MNEVQYPPDHKPGMRVPKGGSSCASCDYYKGNLTCGNQYFVKWNGSDRIPAPRPDEYCSDWWEPGKKAATAAAKNLAPMKHLLVIMPAAKPA